MSNWITDRRPMHEDDGPMEYGPAGNISHVTWIKNGDAWKPIPKCEPYVKPKRWEARWNDNLRGHACWSLYYGGEWQDSLIDLDDNNEEHRKAAERIAAIYQEVMP